MKKQDLIRLRSKIVASLANLEVTAFTARSALKESSEVTPNFLQDQSDAAKGELDLKNSLKVHSHSPAQQALLHNALSKMDGGTYGVCEGCEEEINLPGAVKVVVA